MLQRNLLAALIAVLLLGMGIVCPVHAAPNIKDGLWEMTMETSMEGLPFAMPTVTSTIRQCISQKKPVVTDEKSNCRVKNQKVSGNKVSWEMECTDQGTTMSGKGEMTYSGSTCSGTTKMVMTGDGQKMTSTIRMKGKRIDACPTGEVAQNNPIEEQEKKMMAMADKRTPAQKAADQKKAKELGALKIPQEKRDACIYMTDGSINADCAKRWEKLPLREGEYKTTEEEISVLRDGTAVAGSSKKRDSRVCLTPDLPPSVLPTSGEVRRSGNVFTWKTVTDVGGAMTLEEQAGIEVGATGYTGAIIKRVTYNQPQLNYKDMTAYTRLSGTFSSQASCGGRPAASGREPSGRQLSGRAYSAKERKATPEETAAGAVNRALDNPVRNLRNILGF